MKQICIALSLAAFLMVTACNNGPSKAYEDTMVQENTSMSENQVTETPEETPAVPIETHREMKQSYYAMDENVPTIVGELKDGELWLTFNKQHVIDFGIADENTYFLPESPISVTGLVGEPKSFIIADIGQDYNPILCVLTDKGKVQILSLLNTVINGDFRATEIAMKDIVSFKTGPASPVKTEDGSMFYQYTTVYGIDSKGVEHEVPLYDLVNGVEYVEQIEGTDVVFQLYLTDDWKIWYMMGYYLGEKVGELQGRFWPIEADFENQVYTYGYEFTTRIEYSGDDMITTKVKTRGAFNLSAVSYDSNSCVITPLDGVDFCNNGLTKPVKFRITY